MLPLLERFAAALLIACPAAAAAASEAPAVIGIPVDFILFALVLLSVAVFHHHVLLVAVTGLATIVLYKLAFTGFKTGPGLAGLAAHMHHEWVILTNLLCLLVGFALLARHFEDSRVPAALPRARTKPPFQSRGRIGYLVGFFVMLLLLGWHPHERERPQQISPPSAQNAATGAKTSLRADVLTAAGGFRPRPSAMQAELPTLPTQPL